MKLAFCSYREERPPNYWVKPHCHSCAEVVYYHHGISGQSVIDGTTYPITTGCVAVINSRVDHHETHNSAGRVSCLGILTAQTLPQGVFTNMRRVKPIFECIKNEAKEQPRHYQNILELKLQELILLIRRKNESTVNEPRNLAFCKNYIEENYMQKVDISMLAELSGYSYDYFRHLFTETFGTAPQALLIRIRLEKARQLLCESDMSCTDIAYTCGFSDSSQMSRMFRAHYGRKPLEIRKDK